MTKSKESRTCKYCKYKARGCCFYNPPTCIFLPAPEYRFVSAYPPVDDEDRCSKWERNPRLG